MLDKGTGEGVDGGGCGCGSACGTDHASACRGSAGARRGLRLMRGERLGSTHTRLPLSCGPLPGVPGVVGSVLRIDVFVLDRGELVEVAVLDAEFHSNFFWLIDLLFAR